MEAEKRDPGNEVGNRVPYIARAEFQRYSMEKVKTGQVLIYATPCWNPKGSVIVFFCLVVFLISFLEV